MIRFLAAALAVFMAAPGAFGVLVHLCKNRGQVEISACCCHEDQKQQRPTRPIVQQDHTGCCSTMLGQSEQPTFVVERIVPQLDSPIVAALAPHGFDGPQAYVVEEPAYGSRAPPRAIGPPLFVRNCSYLI